MRVKAQSLALVAALAAFVLTACSGGSGTSGSAEDYPSQQLDWTIAFGPGGGNDLMARKLVQIIQDQKLYPADIAVENREGGSGRPAGDTCCPRRVTPTTSRRRPARS